MKNQIVLLLFTLSFGCAEQAEKTGNTQTVETPRSVGFLAGNDSISWALGSDEAIEVWTKWVEYHNTQEIDKILALAADNIKINGPEGEYIEGKEALKGFLGGWFTSANPKFRQQWATAVTDPNGNGMQWIHNAYMVDMTTEEQQITERHFAAVGVKDNLIQQFWIYSGKLPSQ